ncbi:MAG TPA: hypothetical protein DCE42_14905 [Myxococcales bacterium]|nr:hypothetical protein [Myxococcales bacterium]
MSNVHLFFSCLSQAPRFPFKSDLHFLTMQTGMIPDGLERVLCQQVVRCTDAASDKGHQGGDEMYKRYKTKRWLAVGLTGMCAMSTIGCSGPTEQVRDAGEVNQKITQKINKVTKPQKRPLAPKKESLAVTKKKSIPSETSIAAKLTVRDIKEKAKSHVAGKKAPSTQAPPARGDVKMKVAIHKPRSRGHVNTFRYIRGKRHGQGVLTYANGHKKLAYHYNHGARVGVWKRFYRNGKLMWVQPYKEGKRHGKRQAFYSSGKKMSEIHYKDGVRDGVFVMFYKNGNTMVDGLYAEGKRTETWSNFRSNGQMTRQRTYSTGKLTKIRTLRYRGKHLATVAVYMPKTKARTVSYFRRGLKFAINSFKAGRRHGPRIRFYKNGQKRREYNYKNGKPHGMWANWTPEGKIRRVRGYKRGKRHGTWFTVHPNKRVQVAYRDGEEQKRTITHLRKGIKHAVFVSLRKEKKAKHIGFFPNGQKRYEFELVAGKKQGLERRWHQNGRKKSEVMYVAGKRNGKWSQCNAQGSMCVKGAYQDDKRHGQWVVWRARVPNKPLLGQVALKQLNKVALRKETKDAKEAPTPIIKPAPRGE